MYFPFLFLHSIFRWLLVISLLHAIIRSFRGQRSGRAFTKVDDSIRHWTATITHIQLMLGFTLYFISPVVKSFQSDFKANLRFLDLAFFGLIHILLMTVAIVIITIGSALAKRQTVDSLKFRTIWIWFSIGLLLIFLAIPWPFSPLANRPYFRTF